MDRRLWLLVLANILALGTAFPQWNWESEDPWFSTTQRSTTQRITPIPTSNPSPDRNFRRCVKRCPSTSEYDPVCGTDNMTYNNEGKLLCAKKCGVQTEKMHKGVCPPQTTTSTTVSTTQAAVVTPDPGCFKRCPKTAQFNPLCGSNGVTYENESRLKCAQQCGVNVQKLHNGPCSRPPATTTPRAPTRVTTLSPNFISCRRQCVVLPSYQPVCSTDGITFTNESELQCDISCGRRAQKMRDGEC